MATSNISLRRARRIAAGTGCFIEAKAKSGRVRVVSEGDGAFLFCSNNYGNAARRSVERFREDAEAYDRFVAAGSLGNSYRSFVRRVRLKLSDLV